MSNLFYSLNVIHQIIDVVKFNYRSISSLIISLSFKKPKNGNSLLASHF